MKEHLRKYEITCLDFVGAKKQKMQGIIVLLCPGTFFYVFYSEINTLSKMTIQHPILSFY